MDATDPAFYTQNVFLHGPGGQRTIRLDTTTKERFRMLADEIAGFVPSGMAATAMRTAFSDQVARVHQASAGEPQVRQEPENVGMDVDDRELDCIVKLDAEVACQVIQDLGNVKNAQAEIKRHLELLLGLKSIGRGCVAPISARGIADTKTLADDFLLHGFLELDAKLPSDLLTSLATVSISQADSWGRETGAVASGSTERTSINHTILFKKKSFPRAHEQDH